MSRPGSPAFSEMSDLSLLSLPDMSFTFSSAPHSVAASPVVCARRTPAKAPKPTVAASAAFWAVLARTTGIRPDEANAIHGKAEKKRRPGYGFRADAVDATGVRDVDHIADIQDDLVWSDEAEALRAAVWRQTPAQQGTNRRFITSFPRSLRLVDENIGSVDGPFAKFANVAELSLSCNALEDIDQAALPPQVSVLHLGGNPLTRVPCLDRLPLHHLGLTHCRVDDSGLEPLAACTGLLSLDLSNNNLFDLARVVDALRPLSAVRHLHLAGNPCVLRKGYRHYVVTELPHVLMLDGALVTDEERSRESVLGGADEVDVPTCSIKVQLDRVTMPRVGDKPEKFAARLPPHTRSVEYYAEFDFADEHVRVGPLEEHVSEEEAAARAEAEAAAAAARAKAAKKGGKKAAAAAAAADADQNDAGAQSKWITLDVDIARVFTVPTDTSTRDVLRHRGILVTFSREVRYEAAAAPEPVVESKASSSKKGKQKSKGKAPPSPEPRPPSPQQPDVPMPDPIKEPIGFVHIDLNDLTDGTTTSVAAAKAVLAPPEDMPKVYIKSTHFPALGITTQPQAGGGKPFAPRSLEASCARRGYIHTDYAVTLHAVAGMFGG